MEQFSFGGVNLEDANIIHDSTKGLFRNPVGAVTCGTQITFGLLISGTHFDNATLCVLRDGAIERVLLRAEDGMLRARYTASGAEASGGCVLWYWFEVTLQGGAVCYYGANPPYPSGLGCIYRNPPPAFQITVYEESFATPDWAKSAVLYQIFPDRFAMGDANGVRAGVEWHRAKGRSEIELHENWNDSPVYEAVEGRKYYMPSDVFGGDLDGIRSRMQYLKELGVTLLYLNPIFE